MSSQRAGHLSVLISSQQGFAGISPANRSIAWVQTTEAIARH